MAQGLASRYDARTDHRQSVRQELNIISNGRATIR
jgi:hypothetical protein